MKPDLRAVPSTIPEPPYPRETKANGWKPEFDSDLIYQSDTWTLAADDERPWLLRIWLESWQSVPAGSMPGDRTVFAKRIGCTRQFLDAHQDILLRGWVLHSDGRLYHSHIAGQISAMLATRRGKADRVRAYRQKQQEKQQQAAQCSGNVHASSTQEQEQEQELPSVVCLPSFGGSTVPASAEPARDAENDAEQPKKDPPATPCPYTKIRQLWIDICPTLTRPLPVENWTDARKATIRARWQNELPDIEAWEATFRKVAASRFLTGQVRTTDGRKPFQADLFWIAKPENLSKLYEGRYNNG